MFNYVKRLIEPNYQKQIGAFASLVADENGKVQWVSDKFLKLVGKTEPEVIGQDFPMVSTWLFTEPPEEVEEQYKAEMKQLFPPQTTVVIENATAAIRIKLSSFNEFGKNKFAAVFLNK